MIIIFLIYLLIISIIIIIIVKHSILDLGAGIGQTINYTTFSLITK